jgi:hypothetical protein
VGCVQSISFGHDNHTVGIIVKETKNKQPNPYIYRLQHLIGSTIKTIYTDKIICFNSNKIIQVILKCYKGIYYKYVQKKNVGKESGLCSKASC